MNNLLKQYNEVPKILLQPKKATYDQYQLYPEEFERENIEMIRHSFEVINPDKHKLTCYLFLRKDRLIVKDPDEEGEQDIEKDMDSEDEDEDEDEEGEIDPGTNLIVFLHPRGGNVTEGKFLISAFTPQNAVLLFDFAGSGRSEGEYITLGMNETRDLKRVLDETRKLIKVRRVVLWGRSMGAVTALMFTKIFNHTKKFLMPMDEYRQRKKKFFDRLEKQNQKREEEKAKENEGNSAIPDNAKDPSKGEDNESQNMKDDLMSKVASTHKAPKTTKGGKLNPKVELSRLLDEIGIDHIEWDYMIFWRDTNGILGF